MSAEQAVSIAAIAVMLGVSRSTVYAKANSGEIPGFKVGRVWRFYPSVVNAHLQRPVDLWAMPPAARRHLRAAQTKRAS